jgi:HAD superfamily hydrolase (TIGR01509 family)
LSVALGDEEALITHLHKRKTDIFLEMLEVGTLPLRPGVRRLMEEINKLGLLLGVCTTSDERAARAVTSTILKGIRFDLVLAGDVVARKKPDPEIYYLALQKVGLQGCECIAIEDSHIGVEAAKEAGLFVVATTNPYTEHEDLDKADIVVTCLGDPGGEKGTLRRGSLRHDGVLRARQLVEHFSK